MTFLGKQTPILPSIEVQSMEKEKEGSEGGNLEGEKITPDRLRSTAIRRFKGLLRSEENDRAEMLE